jgi:TIR domain
VLEEKVFISYRREDAPGYAGRIYDHPSREFGQDCLFLDVDKIPPGTSFAQYITASIQESVVVVARNRSTLAGYHGRTGKSPPQRPRRFCGP